MVVEAHRHCAICGKPIPMDESFCSDKCQEQYQMKQKQLSKQRKMLYAVILLFIVIWFVMVVL